MQVEPSKLIPLTHFSKALRLKSPCAEFCLRRLRRLRRLSSAGFEDMGKKKTIMPNQGQGTKKMPKDFPCPLASCGGASPSRTSVEVKLKRASGIAELHCRTCKATWSRKIDSPLDEPVDVYYSWIDALEAVNVKKKQHSATESNYPTTSTSERLG